MLICDKKKLKYAKPGEGFKILQTSRIISRLRKQDLLNYNRTLCTSLDKNAILHLRGNVGTSSNFHVSNSQVHLLDLI